ncbi:phosphate transporter (Pho88) [Mucor velutinosus]|uniref:Phosphate transporter (Pho88) n=1 Tax=Mucor velutinosus TaxID=708070 RepID=A0AAN7HWD8_9FUNG|nr:phosphate transporter (Pho88) [Mucor velutinosus]
MGKTVTYGIQYKQADNLTEGYKFHVSKYNSYLAGNNRIKAAETALELIEWLEADSNKLAEEDEYKFTAVMRKSIDLSRKAVRILEDINYKSLLPRAHKSIGQSYLVLCEYESAVKHGLKAIGLLEELQSMHQSLPKMKSLFQSTYRMLGDIYFMKSNDTSASRYADYEHAQKYYGLERNMIDTMTLDDIEDPQEDDMKRLVQSSYFNLGVMESKVHTTYNEGEANLKRAITLAQELKDYASEKSAWWELGNLYKRTQQYDLVKECQRREYQLVTQHEFTEDQRLCFEERMKIHLFLGEYNECAYLYKEAEETETDSIHAYESLFNIVKKVKSAKEQLESLITTNNMNASTSALFLEFIELLQKFDLYRMLIKFVDDNLIALLNTRDFSHLIYAQLLQYKTEAQWELRESRKEEYLKSCNETFDYVEAYFMDSPLNQLQLTIGVFKIRVKIHEYFDQDFQMESCKKMLTEAIKEERMMTQKLQNNYTMDVTFPGHSRITPVLNKDTKKKIRVKILFSTPKELIIQYDPVPETVQKLMEDIASRCWSHYGVEPIMSHMRTMDHDIYPQDYVRNIIVQENQYMEAIVTGNAKKSPLQIYLNACERLHIELSKEIRLKLAKEGYKHISLAELCITKEQLAAIQQVLQHSPLLQTLNLSSTTLNDDNLSYLLEHANKGLSELHVCNNQLTAKCLDTLSRFRLRTLDLSHNSMGPALMRQLPRLLEKIPALKQLSIQNTGIGRFTEIDEAVKALYSNHGRKGSQGANLSLDISNNYFDCNMLTLWTPLWTCLKRIYKLELSSLSTEAKWLNFDLLSDLPKLSDLNFNFTLASTLSYNFKDFFKYKRLLNHIDFTGCGLGKQDIMILANNLQDASKLRKLTLNSNPDIGDAGMILLNGAIKQSKIDILDISDCGITIAIVDHVLQWTNHLKQLDATKNPKFVMKEGEYQRSFTCLVKLDDGANASNNNKNDTTDSQSNIRSTFGLSFQPMDTLPDTPF